MVAVLVEVDGGGVLVEQQALHPSGDSQMACANATSDTWYLADGSTVEGSIDQIVLSNPYDQTVVASLEFATREGARAPGSYSGLTVPARSTRVIDLGAPGAGAQGEPVLAVSVETTRGRLVVSRFAALPRRRPAGHAGQPRRAGPARSVVVRERPQGRRRSPSATRSTTPPTTTSRSTRSCSFVDGAIPADPIDVPRTRSSTFDPATIEGLPNGTLQRRVRHARRRVGDRRARPPRRCSTSRRARRCSPGPTPRSDGFYATTWYVPVGPAEPTTAALVIHNADNAEGTVTVSALGADGPVPVPGLDEHRAPGRAAHHASTSPIRSCSTARS